MKLLLALLLVGSALAPAQAPQSAGAIQGDVIDPTGAAVPGVRIRAVHAASGAARMAVSNSAGHFRIAGLPLGVYTLRLDLDGFAPVTVGPFTVSLGQAATHRLEMRPAQIIERVEVQGQPEALEEASTTAAATLGGDRIEEAPASNRNYLNFVLIAPGAAPSAGSDAQRSRSGVRSATPDSGFTFSGMRGRNNSLSIDGVDNRDETTGGTRVAIGLEMVEEFRVSSSVMGAEFGGAAGGIVNVVTRSGSNLWHGDFTYFAQNERFNARNPEAIVSFQPESRRYQPGVSLIGPFRRDRTFFATAVEYQKESSEEWSDGSAAAAGINQALSAPAFSGAPVRVQRGLFPTSSRDAQFSFKANHQISTASTISARYAFSRGIIRNGVEGVDNFADLSSRGSSRTADHALAASWTHVPSPHLVNDIRVQLARRTVDLTPNARGAALEIPGVISFGQSYRLDAARTEDHGEIAAGVNYAAGKHQIGIGGNLHVVDLAARLANRFAGLYLFPTVADFFAARPDVFVQAFGNPTTNLHTVPAGIWFQDRWQPLAGITVEAGLRYDRQRMPAGLPSSSNNVAPRFGLAWKPGRKPYVFRAGIGWFYDRYPLAFLNDAVQKDGRNGYEIYAAGAAAAAIFAQTRGGSLSEAASTLLPRSTYSASPHFPSTYSRKVTLGVERSLGKDTRATFEYGYVRGYALPRIRNVLGTLPARYELEQTASSVYHGGSLSVNRRMSKELTFLATYNLGRTRDDASDFDEHPSDPRNLPADWARSRQNQTHRFSFSSVFELPDEATEWAPAWLRDG
ncbi:MAG: carboxypeptidase regulatory-like domain-containing protein, partial [Bryobacteraceae bacterium]